MPVSRKPLWTLAARWVLPVAGDPIPRGAVTIEEERILAVSPSSGQTPDIDFRNAAILPGFVNAHTHLDLGPLNDGGSPPVCFMDWLRAVIRQRRDLSAGQVHRNILSGLEQSVARGTTLLGDVSARGMSWPVLASSRCLRAVVFYELLGLSKARAPQSWAAACQWLSSHPRLETCRPGLSPHAPYSVRASLFRAAANWAETAHRWADPGAPGLAMHLAETSAELELLAGHTGPFVPFLSELGVWDPQGLVKGIDEVRQLTAPAPSVVFVHGNYLDPQLSLPPGTSIVYCPRTHAAFGHEPHPFRALLARGVRVALGTDSLASNPDLDVLAEARFLHRRYPDVSGATLLRMATLSGAEALGWQDETGTLTPGKSADLVVLPLPAEETLDPHESILSSSTPVQAVLFRGKWVYQRQGNP